MNYTLKQLQDRVSSMIKEQGEDAECAAWIYTKNDCHLKDEDGNFDYGNNVEDPALIARIFDDVGNIDYIYQVIQECVDEVTEENLMSYQQELVWWNLLSFVSKVVGWKYQTNYHPQLNGLQSSTNLLTNIMLKGQVLKVVGETSNKIDANMTRLEKFEVFCRVCDGLLKDGRISAAKHHSWTNIF